MASSAYPGREPRLLKWGFVAPTLILLIAFNVYPLVFNVVAGFTNMRPETPDWKWVGGSNYDRVFTDERYAEAIRTTALFTVVVVAVELVLGFLIALALRQDFPGKTVTLTVLLIPMMLSPAVMGLFWSHLLDPDWGVMNKALGVLGITGPAWTSDPSWKLPAIMLVDIWMWTPFMMLISLAALNSIPKYIYEAAEIDRAGRWTVFWRITLPMCAPLLILAVLLRTTDALKQFDFVATMIGANVPDTQTLSALLFDMARRQGRIGLSSAYGFVVLISVIALATLFTRYIGYFQKRQGKAAA